MRRLLILVLLALLPAAARAHGPTPHKIDETVAIAASPDAVWAVIKDFGGIAAWHPMVESSKGGGNTPGADRSVELKSGGTLVDGLDEYDEAGRTYSYRLSNEDVQHFPVSSYSATITVKPAGDGSEVEWIGRFYRGDTGNEPPDTLNDEAAETAMTGFFRSGLDQIKAIAEQK